MSAAGEGTNAPWVIAMRTPFGEPKLLRWAPSASLAARSAETAGEFVEVALKG